MILEWQPQRIQQYCEAIAQPSLQRLAAQGVWSENPNQRGHHLTGLRLPAGTALEKLKAAANSENIFVSFRGNAVRISPHLYNNVEEIEKLEQVILDSLA